MLETVHLDQKAITHWHQTRQLSGQSSSPDMEQRALAYFDYLTRFVFPLCSALQDRPLPSEPVTKAIYLIDGSSICLRQAWNLRDFSQDVSWILATCYPETIDRIFVSESHWTMGLRADLRTALQSSVILPQDVEYAEEVYRPGDC